MPRAISRAYRDAIAAIGAAAAGRRGRRGAGHLGQALGACIRATRWRSAIACCASCRRACSRWRGRARDAGIGFTIDAEEADRLDLSLDLIEALGARADLAGWDGLGLAVQAYQKRALPVIDWLADLARRGRRRLMVRLVKGAYWDSEIKRARSAGSTAIRSSPASSRPMSPTSPAPAGCSPHGAVFYPQFATHNAHTVAAVLELAGERRDWEFQRLHGMGEALYEQIVGPSISTGRAASMRRSAATRICSPIWCGGCSRTAPTPPSSTASSTSARRSTRSSPIRSRASPGCRSSRIRASRCRAISTRRRARTRAGSIWPIRRRSTALRDGLAAALRQPWHAAPIIGGVEQPGAARAGARPERSPPPRRHGRRGRAGSSVDRALARAPRSAARAGTRTAGRRARRDPRTRRRSLRERTAPS